MRRAYLLSFLVLTLAILITGCQPAPNFWVEAKKDQKRILVTFPPLYSIAQAVAGEDGYVLCMLTTQGPHGYDGALTDNQKVNKADFFIANGLYLDDAFVDRMMRTHKNSKLVVLKVGEALEEKHKDLLKVAEHDHDHMHGDHKHHHHGEHDPHVWLGPQQAIAMTTIIAAKLSEIDPANAKGYEKRAKDFIVKLAALEDEGKAMFKKKQNKKIVTMHESFGYFADAFGLEIVATIQKAPGLDPDAATRQHLAKLCVEKKVAAIAVEPQYQYSDAQAKALQEDLKRRGLDVPIVHLDPIETVDALAKDSKFNPEPGYYLKKMKQNIDELAKALP